MQDALGQRGETIFVVLMTALDMDSAPLFRPHFLGDKWPTVDFIVELVQEAAATPYFFVQVKTTRAGFTKRGNRLKVRVRERDVQALAAYPAPTYVVGIDERTEQGYIVSANGESRGALSSLSTRFPAERRRPRPTVARGAGLLAGGRGTRRRLTVHRS